ncbi:helix-turn-helix domain-containing protein [Actinomycetes bacterium KLBMP 9759]
MVTRRTYGDRCGVAHALDMLGERWALLVVRDLLLGPKRFRDLQAGLPGCGPNVLTTRLNELQDAGVVRKRTLPPPAGSRVYELTEWGAELEPIVVALGVWGARAPVLRPRGELRADSLMLSVREALDPAALGPEGRVVEVHLGEDTFTVDARDSVRVSRGQTTRHPDAVVQVDAQSLGALMAGEDDVDAAVAADRVQLQVDVSAGLDFLRAIHATDLSRAASAG